MSLYFFLCARALDLRSLATEGTQESKKLPLLMKKGFFQSLRFVKASKARAGDVGRGS